MITRPVNPEEKELFDAVAEHPTQSWAWGDFRKATGQTVERLGMFDEAGKLQSAIQVTFHSLPIVGGTAGYVSKGPQPSSAMFTALKALGQRHRSVFIKIEPSTLAPAEQKEPFAAIEKMLEENGAVPGKTLFTPYTFVLDLTPSQEEILNNLKSKTRYNVRLAKKKGVTIVEDTSENGMEEYLRLLHETTDRQGFYAHNDEYFRTMWKVLGNSGMIRILKAEYEGKVITAWILFIFNGVGYYPYGASSREHRDVMANNLMMWEALMLAKEAGCTKFDMWGALGPDADPSHKWYGFHTFKAGYGAQLMQSIKSHDLVIQPPMYSLFTLADSLRWAVLRFRKQIGF